jgi:hypothetical protein
MEAFNFYFIYWRSLRSDYYKRKSPVFLIKCLQTVRVEKALFPDFSGSSSQVEYKLWERKIAQKYFEVWMDVGVEDNRINGRGLFDLVMN